MATWGLAHSPWPQLLRTRLKYTIWSPQYLPTHLRVAKTFFNSSIFAAEHPSLIAMRNRPYPSEGWDASLFEAPAETLDVTAADFRTQSPCHVLTEVIRNRDFGQVEGIRAELETMGVNIEPDTAYSYVAVEALKHDHDEGRVSKFMYWWSLVPPPHENDLYWTCATLNSKDLETTLDPTSRRMAKAALHAARIGYAARSAATFLPILLPKFTTKPRKRIMALVYDFCNMDLAWRRKERPDRWKAHEMERAFIFRYAIRASIFSGHLPTAVALLRRAIHLRIDIQRRMFADLIRHLDRNDQPAKAERVRGMWKQQGGNDDLSMAVTLNDAGLQQTYNRTVKVLKNSKLPLSIELEHYIKASVEKHNTEALNALRLEYLRAPQAKLAALQWARAEMKVYADAGMKLAVLAVFGKYFHQVGVPDTTVINHIVSAFRKQEDQSRKDRGATSSSDQGMGFGTPTKPSSYLFDADYLPDYLTYSTTSLQEKLEPSKYDHAPVWHVLVRMASTLTDLEALYAEFIAMAGRDQAAVRNATNVQGSEGSVAPANGFMGQDTRQFDAVHFNIFIRAFFLRKDEKRALTVLDDMVKLGVQPNIQTYTTVVKRLAISNREEALLWVLNHADFVQPEVSEGRRGLIRLYTHKGEGNRVPPTASLVLRTAAVHHCLSQGHLATARRVVDHLLNVSRYKPGTNHITDAVLERYTAAISKACAKHGRPPRQKIPVEAHA